MATTDTPDSLLLACVQDLHAGELLLAKRLPPLTASIDDAELRAILEAQVARCEGQAARLETLGYDVDGPGNLWMKGITKDAKRDSRSIAPGPLLDVALIGAIRKALAAEIVSYETAVAVAKAVGDVDAQVAAEVNLAEESDADHQLRRRLVDLTASGSTRASPRRARRASAGTSGRSSIRG